MTTLRSKLPVSGSDETTILIDQPKDPKAVLVLAHGAGAGIEHSFFQDLVPRLVTAGFLVMRYNFLYMDQGKKRPDTKTQCYPVTRAAISYAQKSWPNLALFVGGKSMGGRMTSQLLAEEPDLVVNGIVFLGFPLHQAKKPDLKRAEHLARVKAPMLFLQGTRDDLADLELITTTTKSLKLATLKVLEGCDHSFAVLKRSGINHEDVMNDMVAAIESFTKQLS